MSPPTRDAVTSATASPVTASPNAIRSRNRPASAAPAPTERVAATGRRSTTVSVAALVSTSSVPLSSVKVTRTLSVLPASAGATS